MCRIVSWNVHRLSTVNAISTVRDITLHSNADVLLLQEAGSWDNDVFEVGCSWRLFPNKPGGRDVALLLHPRLASWTAWWDCCHYGIAVFVLSGTSQSKQGVLYLTAHLPDRSDNLEVYEEALNSLGELIGRLPNEFEALHCFLGVDANVEVSIEVPMEPHIRNLVTGALWNERSSLFAEFLQT